MRILATISVALILSCGLFAQKGNFGGTRPVVVGGFGSAVFPGGTSATVPGINRNVSPFVSPLGGPRLVFPGTNGFRDGIRQRSTGTFYYPLFVGGGYGYGYPGYGYPGYGYGGSDVPPDMAPPPQQQQPNITVIYPPQPAPVVMNPYAGADNSQSGVRPHMYDVPAPAPDDTAVVPSEPANYLIAFKDHTIYSATNYWVDGDTLHYFTSGNMHNQASLSLVDRDLTVRLNKEAGTDMRLPAAKE
jgi:hypothetical protein